MARRRRRRGGAGLAIVAEINVTPLVDVVLVLLVLFLIVSPLLFKYAEVALPNAATAVAAGGLERHITLTLQPGGRLYFESRPISREDLMAELEREVDPQRAPPVLIRADGEVGWGQVKALMDECHQAGVGDIRLATADAR